MANTARSRRPFIVRALGIFVAVVMVFGIFLYLVGWPHLRVAEAPPVPAPTVPAPTVPGKGTPVGQPEQARVANNKWMVNLDPRAPAARARAGSQVVLMDAAVEQLAGPNAFWIGPVFPTGSKTRAKEAPGNWMLVVTNNSAATTIEPGMQVRVAGVLQQTPPKASDLSSLNAPSKDRVAEDQIYLLASNVGPAANPTH